MLQGFSRLKNTWVLGTLAATAAVALVAGAASGAASGRFARLSQGPRPEGVTPANQRIQDALEVLRRIPAGSTLLATAEKQWKQPLLSVFRWGEASKTDAVITRFYNPATGEERRERKVWIVLKQNQALEDLVLDMAHELVHASSRPSWDPYDPTLTPARYIRAAIEGPGGEVDAVVAECGVSLELASNFGTSADRCKRYLGANAQVSRERIVEEFYRVGRWQDELGTKLGREARGLPLLSAGNPRLFSSTGHTPYPVALLREYDELTRIACDNSRKRQGLAPGGRSPASDGLRDFLKNRCS